MDRRKVGRRYESAAADYLKARGYAILAQNYHAAYGEIDIVAVDQGTLVFVEVKGTQSESFGDSVFKVNARKQKSLAEAARQYIQQTHRNYAEYRFDVITIKRTAGELKIEHLVGAFTL